VSGGGWSQGPRGLAGSVGLPPACGPVRYSTRATLTHAGLVDGLMADTHRRVFREIEREPVRDLCRAPCTAPTAVLPAAMPTALPLCRRPARNRAAWNGYLAGKAILHILQQPLVRRKLRRLRAPCGPFGMPLRGCGPVLQTASPCRSISTQLAANGRRCPFEPARDLAHAVSLGT